MSAAAHPTYTAREILAPGRRPVLVHAGAAAGTPVLFASGLGGAWFDWRTTIDAVTKPSFPLLMDRPGVSVTSPFAAGTTQLDEAVRDLGAVLDAYTTSPAVLVGHSMGAWYAEAYARLHPERVAALVLVDGSLAPAPWPGAQVRQPAITWRKRFAATSGRIAALLASLLGGRVCIGQGPRAGTEHAGTQRVLARRIYRDPQVWQAILAEWAAYPALAAQLARVRADQRLGARSVDVLIATTARAGQADRWLRQQRHHWARVAQESPAAGIHLQVVRPAPHNLMHSHPHVVAAAIDKAISSAIDTAADTARRQEQQ